MHSGGKELDLQLTSGSGDALVLYHQLFLGLLVIGILEDTINRADLNAL